MSDIAEIELSIEAAKNLVSRKEQALKLASNREFKALVLEGYMKDEAVRLVGLSADPNMKNHTDDIFDAIKGISLFRQYMQNIVTMGTVAENELFDQEQTLEEIREAEVGVMQ